MAKTRKGRPAEEKEDDEEEAPDEGEEEEEETEEDLDSDEGVDGMGEEEDDDRDDHQDDDEEEGAAPAKGRKKTRIRPAQGYRKLRAGTFSFFRENMLPLSMLATALCIVGLDYLLLSLFVRDPQSRGEQVGLPFFLILTVSTIPLLGAGTAALYVLRQGRSSTTHFLAFMVSGVATFVVVYFLLNTWHWELPKVAMDHYAILHKGDNSRWDICLGVGGFVGMLFCGWYLGDSVWKRRKFNTLMDVDTKTEFMDNLEDIQDIAYDLTREHQRRVDTRKYEFRIR